MDVVKVFMVVMYGEDREREHEREGKGGKGREGKGRDWTGLDWTGRDGTGRDGTGLDRTGRDGKGRDVVLQAKQTPLNTCYGATRSPSEVPTDSIISRMSVLFNATEQDVVNVEEIKVTTCSPQPLTQQGAKSFKM
ncbi:hypothetical protein E2C01_042806 [Portunus trituberculatus]|uniref:Uncharacterized protein n=1 Tax=Portunus trituberculatus TaxID=210409 RepID=A0A5B7FVS6_PORTR|nr:hypothetical protein [Portunus trituberculatus]